MADEDLPESRVIDSITKPFEATNFMRYGTAFHKILETPEKYLRKDAQPIRLPKRGVTYEPQDVYKADGIAFLATDVEQAMQHVLPSALREFRAHKPYLLKTGETVHVTGKVDQIWGNEIIEYKTKWGEFDIASYYDSIQWRIYLSLFEVEAVSYKVFVMKERDRMSPFADHPALDLVGIHPFTFNAYEGLEADIMETINAFVEWAKMRGLEGYLMPRKESALDVY